MLDLSTVLADRYGRAAGTVFLVGFWAAAMSSLVGVWNGVSLMFADFVGHVRGHDAEHPDSRAGGKYYKAYVLWLTFPPVALIFLGQPVYLILAYGVLGAFFMPFLAVTLLWILNTDRVPGEWRNRIPSNIALVLCALAFGTLAVNEIVKALTAL
jgi:Mn2+/Fe2+ NRAMP family transporter